MSITSEVVRELLHYDPDSGIFTWRERGRHWFASERSCRSWNTKYSGKRAGHVCTGHITGYQRRAIKLLGVDRHEHRIAWLWMTDDPLPEEIDHRSQDATDNRWKNLRASTHIENGRNQSMDYRNKSGITGVTWLKSRGKWRARCGSYHVGLFANIEDAAKAVAEFRARHRFSSKHGAKKAHYRVDGANDNQA